MNVGDPRFEHMHTLEDLPPHYLRELDNFFSTYKTLQEKETKVLGFFDEKEAEKRLDDAYERYQQQNG